MGPLSGKQHREYLKFAAKERREDAKAELEESRKQQLHEIKLQEAAQKANQSLAHKEEAHAAKMEEAGGPLSKKPTIKVEPISIPLSNPEAGPTDTVPAMLTPGEAVIPRSAAQDPKNKPIIKRMVEEGRQGYADGTTEVPKDESLLDKVVRKIKESMDYKTVPQLEGQLGVAQKAINTRKQVLDDAEKKAVGYATGTINVKDNIARIPIVGPKRVGRKGYADGTEEVPDPFEAKYYRMPVVGTPSTNNELIPNPTPMGPVPNEAAMRVAVQDTPADKAFYSNIKDDPEQNKKEILKELAKAKPGSMQHQVLTEELAKLSGATIPPKQPMYDVKIASPDYLTGKNPNGKNPPSPNSALRSRGAFYRIEGDKVVDVNKSLYPGDNPFIIQGEFPGSEPVPKPVAEPLPPTGAGAGQGNSRAVDPEIINKANASIAEVARENEPQIQAQAEAIRSDPKTTPAQKKSLMESLLADLYGDKGIFNQKDLVRFAVIGAGGLLTGGTVNGSLRYAARDVLANSDKRHAMEYASNERKELALDAELRAEKTKFESLNASVNIPADAKREIEKMLTFKPEATTAEKIAAVRNANILLGQHAARAAKVSPMSIEDGYINGKPVQFREDKNTGIRYIKSNDEWVPTKQKIIPSVEYDRQTKDLQDAIIPRIASKLHKANNAAGGKESGDSINARAREVAVVFQSLKDEIGDVNRNDFSKMVEDTLAQSDSHKLTEEALRKAFYGNAVVRLRESVRDKYYTATNKDGSRGMPSAEALAVYGNKLQEYAKKGMSIDEAAKALEDKFDEFKKKEPNKYNLLNSVAGTGYSPFLQWVKNGI